MLGFYGARRVGRSQFRPPDVTWVVPCFGLPEAELCESAPGFPTFAKGSDRKLQSLRKAMRSISAEKNQALFPWIEKQLAPWRGLPDDLKYVAVAESDLMFWAIFAVPGAAGPWQFMADTAKLLRNNALRPLMSVIAF